MSHWHIDVYLPIPSRDERIKATICVPWESIVIFDGILIVKQMGPLFVRAFAPGMWANLLMVEHD